MTLNNFEKIKVFHSAFGRTPDPESPTLRDEPCRRLRAELVFEEFKELIHELGYKLAYQEYPDISEQQSQIVLVRNELEETDLSLARIAKEAADLEYVTLGTSASLGIDATRAYADVHQSNMSKLGPNGEVIRRADGKVLKSELYKPADLSWIYEKETE